MALFTVMRATVTVDPVQPSVTGFTCIIATNWPLVVFTDLNEGIELPDPDAARPIPGSEFVQL